jgi:AcrR family transcriptional regulator
MPKSKSVAEKTTLPGTPKRSSVPARQGMDNKRATTKALNRQAILDAARAVFGANGYGATHVRDIIGRTGLASGTFYNYFRSKEEIYEAILDQNALRLRPRLRAERIRAKSIEDFVAGGFATFFDYVANDEMMFRVVHEQSKRPNMRMDTPEILAGFDELRQDIETAIAAGILPNVDAGYLMAAIAGIAFEVGNRMVERTPPDPKGAAAFATTMVLGGLSLMRTTK